MNRGHGQWLKSIAFKLPIIDEDLNISLDNDEQVDGTITKNEREFKSRKVALKLRN